MLTHSLSSSVQYLWSYIRSYIFCQSWTENLLFVYLALFVIHTECHRSDYYPFSFFFNSHVTCLTNEPQCNPHFNLAAVIILTFNFRDLCDSRWYLKLRHIFVGFYFPQRLSLKFCCSEVFGKIRYLISTSYGWTCNDVTDYVISWIAHLLLKELVTCFTVN